MTSTTETTRVLTKQEKLQKLRMIHARVQNKIKEDKEQEVTNETIRSLEVLIFDWFAFW